MFRRSHPLFACLALAALTLAVVVWRQQREIERLTRALAKARAIPAPLTGAQNGNAPRITVTTPRALSRSPLPGQLRSEEGDEEAGRARPSGRQAGGLARLMENPTFVRTLAVHQEGTLDARFAGLFRRLALAPEELVALKRLLVERDNAALDVIAIDADQPGSLSASTLQASIRTARAQVEEAIARSLGSERYAVYDDYVRTLPQRAVVGRLEQRLSYTDAPLTATQSEALVAILAEQTAPAPTTSRVSTPLLLDGAIVEAAPLVSIVAAAERISDQAVQQAETILSPPQITALRQVQVEVAATAQASELIGEVLPVVGSAEPTDEFTGAMYILLQ